MAPPALHRCLLTIDELCRKLSVDQVWFSRTANKKKLKALGFPAAVPGFGRRWDPRAIDLWLDKVGGLKREIEIAPPATTLTLFVNPDELAASQKKLQGRIAQLGERHQ